MWLKDQLNPLLIGLILALFLNVPLGVIERHLFPKHPTSRKTKMRRPLAILLSFILVIGVFVGVAFLVIPELIDAVSIVHIILDEWSWINWWHLKARLTILKSHSENSCPKLILIFLN